MTNLIRFFVFQFRIASKIKLLFADCHLAVEQQESATWQEEERETKNCRSQEASSHQEALVFDGTVLRETHGSPAPGVACLL